MVVGVVVVGGGVDVKCKVLNVHGRRLSKSNKCEQGGRGSKFWLFCENVIVECPRANKCFLICKSIYILKVCF